MTVIQATMIISCVIMLRKPAFKKGIIPHTVSDRNP